MISPRGTWVALGVGIVSIAAAAAPVVAAVAAAQNPLVVLFGPTVGPKISAACAIVAAVCVAIAAVGRSIDPKTDAGPPKP